VSTFGELVSSIHSSLHSYTGVQEQSTWLTVAISSTSALTCSVNSSDTIHKGIAEIDDELVYVETSDSSGLTFAPYGRGYRGSTAATHLIDSQVTFDPSFPRLEIKRAINQVVAGLYPNLYQLKTADLVYTSSIVGYDLPADCDGIVQVSWQMPTPLNDWQPIWHWSFDSLSPDSNGNKLSIYQGITPGADIRVTYRAPFGALSADADTLTSVGIPESFADLILYGVAARMVRFLDPARLQVHSVENLSRSQVVQSGDAGRVANQLYAMHQQRISEERRKLLSLTPSQINFQR
jgi:hypothetical protein